jgi:methyl coenzyme M reductase subunit D
MTVTARRSLPALDRLEREYRSKIGNKYSEAIRDCEIKVSYLKEERTKKIMEELEKFCLAKYPDELVKILRCESKHSRNDTSYVELGFKYEPKKVDKELISLIEVQKQLEDDKVSDYATIDRWQLDQLAAMASGEGMAVPTLSFDPIKLKK